MEGESVNVPRVGPRCAAVMILAAPAVAGPAVVFNDISAAAGIELTGVLSESLCWGDYDNDGDPDLYLTNQNVANNLFRNDGGGLFDGRGVAFSDFDIDGDLDLCVTADLGRLD